MTHAQPERARPPNARRRVIQWHLSTSVILTVVAALVLWRNIAYRTDAWYSPIRGSENAEEMALQMMSEGKVKLTGWPMVYRWKPDKGFSDMEFVLFPLILNILVSGAILLGLGVLLEWRIRRKAGGVDFPGQPDVGA